MVCSFAVYLGNAVQCRLGALGMHFGLYRVHCGYPVSVDCNAAMHPTEVSYHLQHAVLEGGRGGYLDTFPIANIWG